MGWGGEQVFYWCSGTQRTTIPCLSVTRKDEACSPVLQVLDAAQTLEPAVHHDAQPGAQRLTLLHAAKKNQQKFIKSTEDNAEPFHASPV